MSYDTESRLLAKAISLAAEAHIKQFDRGGKPYILHCLTVMHKVKSEDPQVLQVAVMHDLLEDTAVTADTLLEMGFHRDVVAAIRLLTHEEGESYDEYIKNIRNNEIARLVKMADIRHNSDVTRLKGVELKDLVRMEKYHKAYLYLQRVL